MSTRLLCFLGNPDHQYRATRHNAAWMAAEALSVYPDLEWTEKFRSRYAELRSGSGKTVLLMPLTYMNRSGQSVCAAASFYKVPPEDVVVVHDDLELPFGTIGTRLGGGLAGHNGLRSIKTCLGTGDFIRVRIGIGRPPRGSVSSWVLSRFSPDQEAVLPRILNTTAGLIEEKILSGSHPDSPVRTETITVLPE
jgi:peptidyl-tRNA hydrolase, PTH1 family